jgi:2-polyprenyl-3-methyl-5-hydroxy-6-metoxy-1,4-benzoquinol methylase
MQERQKNRALYFEELAITSRKYFIPYISRFKKITPGMNVLEIGCGDGGNLLAFAEMGCNTLGVDMAKERIHDAARFFRERNVKGEFIASNIFELKELEHRFDIIVCHDVLEHIEDKSLFLANMQNYVNYGEGNFLVFPCLANAVRRSSADMQQQNYFPLALYPPAA